MRKHIVGLLALLAACDHASPFTPASQGSVTPFSDARPVRLTYGGASSQAWLTPDELIYSGTQPEHARDTRADVCLGILPATGGHRLRSICNTSAFDRDTLDAYTLPALLADGTMAFRRSRTPFRTGEEETGIVLTTVDAAPSGAVVRSLPFLSTDGFIYDIRDLAWLAPDTLLFLGQEDVEEIICPTCDPIHYRRWKDVFQVIPSRGPEATVVPGTRFATSMTVGPDGHSLFLTFPMDSRVIRLDLATGDTTTAIDFGPGVVPFDLDQRDGYLVAVVPDGPAHALRVIDLATGGVSAIVLDHLLAHAPRVGPAGRVITVLAAEYVDVPGGGIAVTSGDDLYRLEVP